LHPPCRAGGICKRSTDPRETRQKTGAGTPIPLQFSDGCTLAQPVQFRCRNPGDRLGQFGTSMYSFSVSCMYCFFIAADLSHTSLCPGLHISRNLPQTLLPLAQFSLVFFPTRRIIGNERHSPASAANDNGSRSCSFRFRIPFSLTSPHYGRGCPPASCSRNEKRGKTVSGECLFAHDSATNGHLLFRTGRPRPPSLLSAFSGEYSETTRVRCCMARAFPSFKTAFRSPN
jgi:hypothetical protein